MIRRAHGFHPHRGSAGLPRHGAAVRDRTHAARGGALGCREDLPRGGAARGGGAGLRRHLCARRCRRRGPVALRCGADHGGAGRGLPQHGGLHLDPQHGRLDDRRLRRRRAAPALPAQALLDGAFRQLLPDRARRRLRCRGAGDSRRAARRPLCRERQQGFHLRRRAQRHLCRDAAYRRAGRGRDLDARGRGGDAGPVASASRSRSSAGTASRPRR